jgi:putative transposase
MTFLLKVLNVGCLALQMNALKARQRRRQLTNEMAEQSIIGPNVLEREFETVSPNQKWVAGFTFIWSTESWLYVVVVIDLFSRRVASWDGP